MDSDLVVVIIATVLNTCLTLVVLLRNPRKAQNITFGLFGASISLWTFCNYLADHAASNNLLYTRLTALFGSLIAISLVYLSVIFPSKLAVSQRWLKTVFTIAGLNALLCLTAVYVSGVQKTTEGVELSLGVGYTVFCIYLIGYVILAVKNFIKQFKTSGPIARSQIKLLTTGIIVYAGIAIAMNVIIPLLIENWATSKYGPLSTVPFVGITSYAIIKHHLFDVRTFAARITAYTLSLTIVVVLYVGLLTTIVARLVDLERLSAQDVIGLALPTIISALTFTPIKSYVDRQTAKVFFHHPYQIRDVLDDLTDKLMTNSMDEVIRHSLLILHRALLPNTMHLVAIDDNKIFKEATYNEHNRKDLSEYIQVLAKSKHNLYMRDAQSLPKDLDYLMLRDKYDIILRLGDKHQLLGFLCLGEKKSGSIYSAQDGQLLTICAKNLAIALENTKKYEQIQRFADTMQDEVNHATARLRHANQRLKTLDKLKDDFIHMASHQFRTPAGSIRQALRMINDNKLTTDEKHELLRLAEADSEQLVTIVSTMLSISRLQAGRFVITRSHAVLQKLLESVISTTKILADQKNITLQIKQPSLPVSLSVDGVKLKEAMKNYIENAIKYSPSGSTVSISLFVQDNELHFEVTDQGMGVPEDERTHLFGKFYRAKNAQQEQPDGNGIGLYVVKNIAEGHGGQVYYQPSNPGSLFGFRLPAKEASH